MDPTNKGLSLMQRTDRTKLLAEEARHLAERTRDLERRVSSTVDRVAAGSATRARLELEDLADLLTEVDR